MKKFLLATTALGMLAAGSAFAEVPKVSVGGSADFQIGSSDQEAVFETEANQFNRDVHTRTDTRVHIKADGRTDSGLAYGAYISLNADVNQSDTSGGNNNAERTFLYLESGFGRMEAGANSSASATMKYDASTFARATGGISGDFLRYVELDGDSAGTRDTFIITPDMPTEGFPGYVEEGTATSSDFATANKITYYSPRISGVQLGVSFTPDLEERGTANGFSGEFSTNDRSIENVWNVGVNYEGEWKNFGINASVTGESGSSEVAARDDLKAVALGLNISYAGVTVGGSWSGINEFGQTSATNTTASFYTLGAAYEMGPFAASISYLDSVIDNADGLTADKEFNNISIGADYKLAPGLMPYIEVSFFETDDNVAADTPKNDGTVIIFGTELNF